LNFLKFILGYKPIILILQRDINDFKEEDKERLRKHLLSLSCASRPEDIVFKSFAAGSIVIHTLVRENLVENLIEADLSSLHRDHVVNVNIIGVCIRNLGPTGTTSTKRIV
jgi:hypothetical protein